MYLTGMSRTASSLWSVELSRVRVWGQFFTKIRWFADGRMIGETDSFISLRQMRAETSVTLMFAHGEATLFVNGHLLSRVLPNWPPGIIPYGPRQARRLCMVVHSTIAGAESLSRSAALTTQSLTTHEGSRYAPILESLCL